MAVRLRAQSPKQRCKSLGLGTHLPHPSTAHSDASLTELQALQELLGETERLIQTQREGTMAATAPTPDGTYLKLRVGALTAERLGTKPRSQAASSALANVEAKSGITPLGASQTAPCNVGKVLSLSQSTESEEGAPVVDAAWTFPTERAQLGI